jgi:hypothetical protein
MRDRSARIPEEDEALGDHLHPDRERGVTLRKGSIVADRGLDSIDRSRGLDSFDRQPECGRGAVGSPVNRGGSLLFSAFVDPKSRSACRRFRAEKRLATRWKPSYSRFRGIGPIRTLSIDEPSRDPAGTLGGTTVENTKPLPCPADRHPALFYECHPRLGEYIYDPLIDSWSHQRADLYGRRFHLMGRGRRPSDEQILLWSKIDRRLAELTQAAVEAADSLLVGGRERRIHHE